MSEVSYAHVWEFVDAGMRIGSMTPFAYVLASHLLHRMHAKGERSIAVELPSMYGSLLRFPRTGRYLAGQLEMLVHEGMGAPGLRAGQVSLHYIDALQKLHCSGLLPNTLALPLKGAPDVTDLDRHFTFMPTLREGRDWTEDSTVIYHMPTGSLGSVAARFASLFDPVTETTGEKVSFL